MSDDAAERALQLEAVPEATPTQLALERARAAKQNKRPESLSPQREGTEKRAHATVERLRAINRARDVVKDAYREGRISQTLAAKLGPKNPAPEVAARVAAACVGADRAGVGAAVEGASIFTIRNSGFGATGAASGFGFGCARTLPSWPTRGLELVAVTSSLRSLITSGCDSPHLSAINRSLRLLHSSSRKSNSTARRLSAFVRWSRCDSFPALCGVSARIPHLRRLDGERVAPAPIDRMWPGLARGIVALAWLVMLTSIGACGGRSYDLPPMHPVYPLEARPALHAEAVAPLGPAVPDDTLAIVDPWPHEDGPATIESAPEAPQATVPSEAAPSPPATPRPHWLPPTYYQTADRVPPTYAPPSTPAPPVAPGCAENGSCYRDPSGVNQDSCPKFFRAAPTRAVAFAPRA